MANDDQVPHTDATDGAESKLVPVMDVAEGREQLKKITIDKWQEHLAESLPFLTEPQMREVTDEITAAVLQLSNRVAQVEASGGTPSGGTTPTGPGGSVLYGLWDTTARQPTGEVYRQDYQGLPTSVRLSLGPNPNDMTGFYVQPPAGVTIPSGGFVNVSVDGQRQISTAWVPPADKDDPKRWFISGLPPGTRVIYEVRLESTDAPSDGNQQQGGQTPPPAPVQTGNQRVITYGSLNAAGIPQQTLTQEVATLPATFTNVVFPAVPETNGGWYITLPTGVELVSLQHRDAQGQLSDVKNEWTYLPQTRTWEDKGKTISASVILTITVQTEGG